ncbi:unnamed protein product [Schistocephalus solidus]|uniref:Reverse transcriptase domain-containing protein n=1 Tax=Schistocephalus solidus TaxID=70667 RepID=A0A183SEX9_SCHSO|nr:unnamed protein product [Schistocephalus solidus]
MRITHRSCQSLANRTETGELVPGAPTYSHCTQVHCQHYSRTSTHRMGLLGHMRLHENLRKFGCPERFMHMVLQLRDGMMGRVTNNRKISKAFTVTNGVKLGFVLAPTLFSLIFSAMLMDANRDERPGICIAYRMDG